MICFPHAKINIGLSVIAKRADGYHDIESLLYPINVQDVLEIVPAKENTMHIYAGEQVLHIPKNSCEQALELLRKDFDMPPYHIHLLKNIPIGAGLGGGSADAMALIQLLNTKLSLNLGSEKLQIYANQLGSDCAFFITGKPALVRQRGNVLDPLALNPSDDLSKYYGIIVMPNISISTKEAYSWIQPHTKQTKLSADLRQPMNQWRDAIENDFEKPIGQKYPIILEIKQALYKQGAIYASMSGSGAAIYGIFQAAITLKLPAKYRVFYNIFAKPKTL